MEDWIVVSTLHVVHHLKLVWDSCSLLCAPVSRLGEAPCICFVEFDVRSSVDELSVGLNNLNVVVITFSISCLSLCDDGTHENYDAAEAAKTDDVCAGIDSHCSAAVRGGAHVSLTIIVVGVVRSVRHLLHRVPLIKQLAISEFRLMPYKGISSFNTFRTFKVVLVIAPHLRSLTSTSCLGSAHLRRIVALRHSRFDFVISNVLSEELGILSRMLDCAETCRLFFFCRI